MAISTIDGVLAGFQTAVPFTKIGGASGIAGRHCSCWPVSGNPGIGVQDATLNGAVLSSSSAQVAGQLRHIDPVSGNAYLGRFEAQTENPSPGTLLLCDRLWSNGGFTITSTGVQAITSPTWPARDANGATAGDGVLLGLEVSAATGAGTPTITVDYTNSAGANTRAGTNVEATTATATAGAFYPISLQAGDTGVRSVQSLTLSSSWTSGTINLVAFRVLAALELPAANVPNVIDALTAAFPRLYNGSVPFLIFRTASTSAARIAGVYAETHG